MGATRGNTDLPYYPVVKRVCRLSVQRVIIWLYTEFIEVHYMEASFLCSPRSRCSRVERTGRS